MFGFDSWGKTLMLIGVLLLVTGAIMHFGGKWIPFGRMPGDFHWEKGNFSFHFPLVTSLLLSIILTILLNLFFRR
ncbi:DUF2905 domain-containing protein [Acetonema longum]|uniref:DUF2905 domain-containing protein n=1 Tax=Acetonema longum DSM 6540 TaxID=1009370 RepID=F7NQ91_9FIRM|nr:DUF2905 domain-containing protein [Acetonema longum]EGO61850.1 hypothetical protein ALO_21459 [Acetonema longum DSM 6540]